MIIPVSAILVYKCATMRATPLKGFVGSTGASLVITKPELIDVNVVLDAGLPSPRRRRRNMTDDTRPLLVTGAGGGVGGIGTMVVHALLSQGLPVRAAVHRRAWRHSKRPCQPQRRPNGAPPIRPGDPR